MRIWIVEVDRELSQAERALQKQKIVNNGLEYYARFADEKVARKFADKIKWATGIVMTVCEAFPSSITI